MYTRNVDLWGPLGGVLGGVALAFFRLAASAMMP